MNHLSVDGHVDPNQRTIHQLVGLADPDRFVALALALAKLGVRALREPVAATSVGLLEGGGFALDLCYLEDAKARVDLNVVATGTGKIVEIQGTAEGAPVERRDIDTMVDIALAGIATLAGEQRALLCRAGVELGAITALS